MRVNGSNGMRRQFQAPLHFGAGRRPLTPLEKRAAKSRVVPRMSLLTGTTHPVLAQKISNSLEVPLAPIEALRFAGGEWYMRPKETLRGADVFVIQTANTGTVNDDILQTGILLDTAKRSSTSSITLVHPYLPYGRQERKDKPHAPISARLIADFFIMAGAERLITLNMHASAVEGFYNITVDNLRGEYVLINFLQGIFKNIKSLSIASPDIGRLKMAERIAKILFPKTYFNHLVAIRKKRNKPGHVQESTVVSGRVRGRAIIVIDDMIDGGGTMRSAGRVLKKKGASSIIAAAVHPVFSGEAVIKLSLDENFERIVVTDTINIPEANSLPEKFEVVSIAPLLAEIIRRTFLGESLEGYLEVG